MFIVKNSLDFILVEISLLIYSCLLYISMYYVTIIFTILIFAMYFTINNYQTTIETVNYQLRTFYHADLSHMFGNLFSFIMVSNLENVMGSQQYFLCIVFISVLSSLMLQFYHNVAESRKVYTIGFSAVVYGLLVVYIYALSTNKGVSAVNLVIGLIPQLYMIGISWEGHICGIVSGLIYISLFPIKKTRTDTDKLNNII